MTDWEVARRVRTVLPDVPVIYATGYVEAMEPPVTGSMFLLKPYRVTQLVSAIRALTEKPLIEASRRQS
jgi:CheY-like chemotaxis protein